MSRFFVPIENIGDSDVIITDKNDIKHISKVLRLGEGDKIEISDGSEWEYSAVIESVQPDEVLAKIVDKQKFAKEPETMVTLYQGVPKGSKMDFIVQKCVELGVNSVVPVFMSRTVVVEKGNFGKKIDRWQKISDEAVKQCGRGIIPEISSQVDFDGMLAELGDYDLILFPYENEDNYSIKDCLRNLEEIPVTVAIVIGPEGGFSDMEADKLVEIGAEKVTLGKTVLRTETAGMVALAMTMYELEL